MICEDSRAPSVGPLTGFRARDGRHCLLSSTHNSAHFAILFLFTDGVAFVVLLFAAGDADLNLDAAAFEVEGEGDERDALGLHGLFELADFALVDEKPALAQRFMIELGGGGVGGD